MKLGTKDSGGTVLTLSLFVVSSICFLWLACNSIQAFVDAKAAGDVDRGLLSVLLVYPAAWALGTSLASLGLRGRSRHGRHLLATAVVVFGIAPSLAASAWLLRVNGLA